MQSTLNLQLLTPGDWPLLRDARLEALRESPHAFLSSHTREAGWTEAQWRRAFDTTTWILAHSAGTVIGLAGSVREPGRPSRPHIESVWVAPEHRRRGVSRALVGSLVEIEHEKGVTDLRLWVLED